MRWSCRFLQLRLLGFRLLGWLLDWFLGPEALQVGHGGLGQVRRHPRDVILHLRLRLGAIVGAELLAVPEGGYGAILWWLL